jgi:hypothetical protein
MRTRICANARTMSSLSDSVRCAYRALGLYVFPYGGLSRSEHVIEEER